MTDGFDQEHADRARVASARTLVWTYMAAAMFVGFFFFFFVL
ncbi:hypothetical protein [Blastococcus aurantiacus]|nr:hypothetical protein [Blastococcus aurantiacus]